MLNKLKCPECGSHEIDPEDWIRGYCKECNIKKHTCDGCGQLVQSAMLYMTRKGNLTRTGHKECIYPMLEED